MTYKGEPVTSGSVVFENRELGISQVANLDESGRYEMRMAKAAGIPIGKYAVAIRPNRIANVDSPLAVDPRKNPRPPPFLVPNKYHDPKTSGLAAEVLEGENPPFDFKL